MKEWGNIEGSVEYVKCKSIPRDSKLLDIGCNTGSTIFNLHQYGFTNVYGVDVEKNSINHGKKIYAQISDRLVDYDGIKLPFEDNSFDVVTMFDARIVIGCAFISILSICSELFLAFMVFCI